MTTMIKAYKWIRRVAYLCGGLGLLLLFQSRRREPDGAGPWTQAAFGALAVFFVLLFSSYALFVVIKIQRQRKTLRARPKPPPSILSGEADDPPPGNG